MISPVLQLALHALPAASQVKDKGWLGGKGAEELEELEDECGDDRFLEEYRWRPLGLLPAACVCCLSLDASFCGFCLLPAACGC